MFVVFHGTSRENAESIVAQGFRGNSDGLCNFARIPTDIDGVADLGAIIEVTFNMTEKEAEPYAEYPDRLVDDQPDDEFGPDELGDQVSRTWWFIPPQVVNQRLVQARIIPDDERIRRGHEGWID